MLTLDGKCYTQLQDYSVDAQQYEDLLSRMDAGDVEFSSDSDDCEEDHAVGRGGGRMPKAAANNQKPKKNVSNASGGGET